ncbi:MAG: helix-turn-helix domain-containing protein [Bacteroidetes bacterium]|jgi:transcriptional regulator with XRE-family HTH domain|nr:helix-turn-helix domain-containing protein [Bacteroidota bacterium]
MKKRLYQIVGKRLKAFREARGLSQEAFASMCNLHRTYIGGIERGERNITLETLQAIAETLKISPSELLKEKEEDV